MTVGFGALDFLGDFWDADGNDGEVWIAGAPTDEQAAKVARDGKGRIFMTNPWDTVWVQDRFLPGMCKVKCEPQIHIDNKKEKGADGAKLTLLGYLPGPIQIEVKIWTRAQWAAMRSALKEILWRKPLKDDDAIVRQVMKRQGLTRANARLAASALTIKHPSLVPLGVEKMVVKGVSTPEDGDIVGSKIIRIQCIQFLPPDKVSRAMRPTDRDGLTNVHGAPGGRDPKNGHHKAPSEAELGPDGLAPDAGGGDE
jgi:hypothetical protein